MKHINTFEHFLTENSINYVQESVVNEGSDEQVKKECISRLSDFFRVAPHALSKFNFDGKDNIKELTKALNSTSDQGTELYYQTAIKTVKRDLGVKESVVNEARVKATDKIVIPKLSDIDHTRITKWCSANGIKDYKWENSGDGYIMDTSKMPIRDQQDLDKYLFASRIEYTREFTK